MLLDSAIGVWNGYATGLAPVLVTVAVCVPSWCLAYGKSARVILKYYAAVREEEFS